MQTYSQVKHNLEEVMDEFSASTIIYLLSEIASEKALHVLTNGRNETLARDWERLAKVLDRCYLHVNKVDRLLP